MATPIPSMPLPGWKGGDGNAAYLDKTLRHGGIEVYFDEKVAGRVVRALYLRATFFAFLSLAVLWIFLLVGLFPLTIIGMIAVWFFVFLRSRVEEPISEWRTVLADRATAGSSTYNAIVGKLDERQLPIQSKETRRTATGFGSVNNRLILTDGYYQIYVSVFAYGTSLYLGWMMWRTRRGSALFARFISDLIATIMGRLDLIGRMLRTERARAMREAVHALCREGLNVAIERIEVPDSYAFPAGLPPIESLPGTPTGNRIAAPPQPVRPVNVPANMPMGPPPARPSGPALADWNAPYSADPGVPVRDER
jgi:hypothetical protein